MRKLIVSAAIMAAVVVLVGLGVREERYIVEYEAKCAEITYPNNVFMFPCKGSNFANALDRFVSRRPDLEVVGFSESSGSVAGQFSGNVVLTRPRR